MFSSNTLVEVKVDICAELQIDTDALSTKYLGLPALVGADRSENFVHFVERVIKRLNGGKKNSYPLVGRKFWLKVLHSQSPSFAMSHFKIPKGVCKKITDSIDQFWWGYDNEKKQMHWYTWWNMCFPKMRGGMGFRDVNSFHLALLAKQESRLISTPDFIYARVLTAKYYHRRSLLKAGPKNGSSFTWQCILEGIHVFKCGYIWRICSGNLVNIWDDPWIPTSPTKKIIKERGNMVLTG